MTQRESFAHLRGESQFVDDIPAPQNCLYAAVVTSPVAKGVLTEINLQAAQAYRGVAAVLTAKDIPGENQIGDIVSDECLLADKLLSFIGKPVAMVLADTAEQAHEAAALVQLHYESGVPVLDVREAYSCDSTFGNERHFQKGDPKIAFENARWVVEGQVNTHAQEHLYFETQTALALPQDSHRIKIFSASQSPSAIQKFASRILNIPMHSIEVEVPRLGGAFGGKEEQAKPWALLAALGAYVTQRPVKLTLTRQEDMCWTGKRHPYHATYRLAADETGLLLGYDVQFLQDGGAVADLSTAVLERTLFHATNAYAIPNVNVKAISCRTNHPSNTAFRGFGAPQAIFTLECALDHLASKMRMPRDEIQHKNLLAPGYQFDYGMKVTTNVLQQCWLRLWQEKSHSSVISNIETFNAGNSRYKKGIAFTPLCFGIAFTATHLNQASVLVNIYTDGSVGISISAVEMGQGVSEKIRVIAARIFNLSVSRISVDYTNSSKTANMSPTAASVGADLNGMAALQACEVLKTRLNEFSLAQWNLPVKDVDWDHLVEAAYLERVCLVEHGFYATPDLYFDRVKEQGNPFAYHVYGVSGITATVDCLLGTYTIDNISVVYDLGQSLDPLIDQGQMEGGLVQGVGYATLEDIVWNEQGELETNSFATYKIPDLLSAPAISVDLVASASNPHGPFSAKAIGEPPLLLGLGAYFAIANAMRSFNPKTSITYDLPMTPEKVLLALYPHFESETPAKKADGYVE